jgi:hypothetical protein
MCHRVDEDEPGARRGSCDDHRVDTTQARHRRLSIRKLALMLAAAVMLGSACEAPPPPERDPAPAPTTAPTCPEPGVVLEGKEPEAAMGLRAMKIVMVNCGTRPYEVSGYPAVRVLDADRKPLDIAVDNGSSSVEDPGAELVTLKPGETATAVLVWRNRVTDVGAAVNGSYLEIAPATGEPRQTVPEHIDLGTTGKLEVTAWRRP